MIAPAVAVSSCQRTRLSALFAMELHHANADFCECPFSDHCITISCHYLITAREQNHTSLCFNSHILKKKKKHSCIYSTEFLWIHFINQSLNLALSFFTRNSQDSKTHVEWGAPAENLQESRSNRVGSVVCIVPVHHVPVPLPDFLMCCGDLIVQHLGGTSGRHRPHSGKCAAIV